jgi:hypothetical protein
MSSRDRKWRIGLALLVIGICIQCVFLSEGSLSSFAHLLLEILYMDPERFSSVLLYSYWLLLPAGYLMALAGSWLMKSPTAVVAAHLGVLGPLIQIWLISSSIAT